MRRDALFLALLLSVYCAHTGIAPVDDKKISVSLFDAYVLHVYLLLEQASTLKVAPPRCVRGGVYISVRAAPLTTVFEMVAAKAQLTYTWDGGVLRVGCGLRGALDEAALTAERVAWAARRQPPTYIVSSDDVRAFLQVKAHAECERAVRCAPKLGRAYASVDDCKRRADALEVPFSRFYAGHTLRPDAADACLAAINTEPCGLVNPSFRRDCGQAIQRPNEVDDGQSCTDHLACHPGSWCGPSSESFGRGVCRSHEPLPVGSKCADYGCGSGAFCDARHPDTGRCQPLRLRGESCTSSEQCGGWFVCSVATRTCVERAGLGETCDGAVCLRNLECIGASCQPDPSPADDGAACTRQDSWDAACVNFCVFNRAADAQGRCAHVSLPGAGEPCVVEGHRQHSHCAHGLFVDQRTSEEGVTSCACRLLRPRGDPCLFHAECESGLCRDTHHLAIPPVMGQCADKSPNGEDCIDHGECASAYCDLTTERSVCRALP